MIAAPVSLSGAISVASLFFGRRTLSSGHKKILAAAGSFALGGGLLFLALRGVDFSAVGEALRTASYAWLLPLFVATMSAHLLRAWRWQMLLETLPDEDGAPSERISLRLAFCSLMIGYMVNYAAPRLGEFVRAANVASQTKLRFAGIFGTVVVERVLDALVLLLALLTVAVLFSGRLVQIVDMFSSGLRASLDKLPPAAWILMVVILAGLLIGVVLFARAMWRDRASGEEGKMAGFALSFRDGLASLVRVRRRAGVVFSTLGIWFCYLLMADLPLRLFGFSEAYNLDALDSWALLNVGAVGMSIPSPGGTGSFHYVTVQTLVHVLGVPETPAATYAIFSHAAQLLLMCAVGFACLVLQGTSLKAIRTSANPEKSTQSSGTIEV